MAEPNAPRPIRFARTRVALRRLRVLLVAFLWSALVGSALLWATSYRWPCGLGTDRGGRSSVWLTLPEHPRGHVRAPMPNLLGPNLVQSSSGRLSIWHYDAAPPTGRPSHFRVPGVAMNPWTSASGGGTGVTLWLSHWLLVALSGGPLLVALARRRLRPPPGTCAACGYDLRATPDRCPECGTTTGAT